MTCTILLRDIFLAHWSLSDIVMFRVHCCQTIFMLVIVICIWFFFKDFSHIKWFYWYDAFEFCKHNEYDEFEIYPMHAFEMTRHWSDIELVKRLRAPVRGTFSDCCEQTWFCDTTLQWWYPDIISWRSLTMGMNLNSQNMPHSKLWGIFCEYCRDHDLVIPHYNDWSHAHEEPWQPAWI